jgi:hypothetical protein
VIYFGLLFNALCPNFGPLLLSPTLVSYSCPLLVSPNEILELDLIIRS